MVSDSDVAVAELQRGIRHLLNSPTAITPGGVHLQVAPVPGPPIGFPSEYSLRFENREEIASNGWRRRRPGARLNPVLNALFNEGAYARQRSQTFSTAD